jgi:diguanylate cyclase (GGDEF)-like protein
MEKGRISKKELDDFYQSKFEYFKQVSGYSAFLIAFLEISYFYSDCQLFGRFAYETLIPRMAIIIPLIILIIFNPRHLSYKAGTALYYLLPHAAMWCTIWAIVYLPNKDFAREGFIIMHFAFLAVGLATPLKYHIPIHAGLLLNIIVSNQFIHYEHFALMISLALPVYVGVCTMLLILESSYADQYLIKKKLEISSVSDELTGAFNRYKLTEITDQKNERFISNKDIFVLMLDIDYFKNVNDTYGHEAGDTILKCVAAEIKSQVYGRDYVIRWGGEEFVVILVDYTTLEATRLAEKLRSTIENSGYGICPITVSVGFSKYNKEENYHQVIDRADQALYYAKKHGRNQIVNYSEITAV